MSEKKEGDNATGKVCVACSGDLVSTYGYVWPSEWGSRATGPGGRAPLCWLRTRCSNCGLLYMAGGGLSKPETAEGGREDEKS